MAKKNYQLTEGEWAIIRAVWDNEPCAAPAVQEELEDQKSWTYSTVKTMMDPMMQFLLDNHRLSQKQLSELERLIKKKRIKGRAAGKK